jgi:hypothetical protein
LNPKKENNGGKRNRVAPAPPDETPDHPEDGAP